MLPPSEVASQNEIASRQSPPQRGSQRPKPRHHFPQRPAVKSAIVYFRESCEDGDPFRREPFQRRWENRETSKVNTSPLPGE